MSNYMAINVLCLSSLCATGGAWGVLNRQLTVNGETKTDYIYMAFYMVFNGKHRALTENHSMHGIAMYNFGMAALPISLATCKIDIFFVPLHRGLWRTPA